MSNYTLRGTCQNCGGPCRSSAGYCYKQKCWQHYKQEHRAANLDHYNVIAQQWATKNKEKLRSYAHAYYVQHMEKLKDRAKKHRLADPERWRVYSKNRKARLRNAVGTFTLSEWLALLKLYCFRCLRCGETKPLTVDHVRPISTGGTNFISNIQPLCRSCNSIKAANYIDYRFGYT